MAELATDFLLELTETRLDWRERFRWETAARMLTAQEVDHGVTREARVARAVEMAGQLVDMLERTAPKPAGRDRFAISPS